MSRGRFFDISVLLGRESIDFPGDPPYVRETISDLQSGADCELSSLRMSLHAGTHIDAPAHFIPGGRTIDQYRPEDFVFPAHIIEVRGRGPVQADVLNSRDILPGEVILFKTDNSFSGRCRSGAFTEDFVSLSPGAAARCSEMKAGLVGIDYITAERDTGEGFPVHRSLLGSGILILEGIDLDGVPPGSYTLWCLPLRIGGGEASPVRAVLLR